MERANKSHKALSERACPVCGSSELDHIQKLTQRHMGLQCIHALEVYVSICKNCGFILGSPTVELAELNKYYCDMPALFQPESSYSIEKRITIIQRYLEGRKHIAEIGGNTQSGFRETLEEMFESYDSYDVNETYNNTIVDLGEFPEVDMIVGYHVMEHIIDINNMIQTCYNKLSPDGIFIIEVPDAYAYYLDTNALLMTQHVNHFTPQSLTKLMEKNRFKLLEISRTYASRGSSFVGVFQKQENLIPICFSKSEYMISKSILVEGFKKDAADQCRFEQCVDILAQRFLVPSVDMRFNSGRIAFWCANDILIQIIDKFLEKYHTFDAIIIDEDPRKEEFYLNYSAHTSKQVWESGMIDQVRYLIICSSIRVQSILNTISQYNGNEKIEVYYIDGSYNLRLCTQNKELGG